MSFAFTSMPRSRQYCTAGIQELGALREKLAAQPRPAATIKGVEPLVEAIFGSAPASISMCIALRSVACAARQNAVAPPESTQPWSPDSDRNQTFALNLAFGLAPFARSAF